MLTIAHPTSFPAAASAHAPASCPLELLEARLLRDSLRSLLRTEQSAMADFLVALADFDRRRGWEPLGHSSLFAFLVIELKLSKGAAYVRYTAARLLQSFPEVVVPVREGHLCLSAVGELARVATAENFSAVLPRFFGCSSREAREIAAAILPHPAPPTRDQVTRPTPAADRQVPFHRTGSEPRLAPSPDGVAAALNLELLVDSESVRAHEPAQVHPARVAAPRDDVEPLTADLRRLHVTVSREFLEELEVARDGLSHAIPNATTEQVLKAALRLLLEKQARARGQVKRPRKTVAPTPRTDAPSAPAPASTTPLATATGDTAAPEPFHRREGPREAIPAAVRRAVWERDGGRCAWPLDGGGRCGSTHRLELDHVVPWALGGDDAVANLRVACAAHNRLAARRTYGSRCVDRYAAPAGA